MNKLMSCFLDNGLLPPFYYLKNNEKKREYQYIYSLLSEKFPEEILIMEC